MEQYVSVGFTKKTYGIKGHVKVKISEKYLEDFLKVEVIFLVIHGKKVPYFIENKDFGNALLLKLEDIETREAAIRVTSKEIFLREKDIIPENERELEVEGLEFEPYTGFTIFDEENKEIGEIKEVVEYPQQEMAVVKYQTKEILIPMNHALILEINNDDKHLFMTIPDGLLDL